MAQRYILLCEDELHALQRIASQKSTKLPTITPENQTAVTVSPESSDSQPQELAIAQTYPASWNSVVDTENSQAEDLFPKKYRGACGRIIRTFDKLPELIWDKDTGEITIKGQKITGSNIYELVYALGVPYSFSKQQPKGLDQLIEYLKAKNIPIFLVRNGRYRNQLAGEETRILLPRTEEPIPKKRLVSSTRTSVPLPSGWTSFFAKDGKH